MDASNGIDTAFIEKVVERWRGATTGNKRKAAEGALEDSERTAGACARAERPPPESALALRREPFARHGQDGAGNARQIITAQVSAGLTASRDSHANFRRPIIARMKPCRKPNDRPMARKSSIGLQRRSRMVRQM